MSPIKDETLTQQRSTTMIDATKLNRFIELGELEKKIKAEKAMLRAFILDNMEGKDSYIDAANGVKVLVDVSSRTTLDSKALKTEKPDVYAVYSRTSDVTKVTVKSIPIVAD